MRRDAAGFIRDVSLYRKHLRDLKHNEIRGTSSPYTGTIRKREFIRCRALPHRYKPILNLMIIFHFFGGGPCRLR